VTGNDVHTNEDIKENISKTLIEKSGENKKKKGNPNEIIIGRVK